jgi:hypothetical protein
MMYHHAVVVHGTGHAMAALRPGRPVLLLSGRGAALHAGCLWWLNLVERARQLFPATPTQALLDCADAPGRAMEALRVGVRGLVLDPACPAYSAVAAVCHDLGASLSPVRPPALDLAEPGALYRLDAWLAKEDAHDPLG